jgi:hypothetical protein
MQGRTLVNNVIVLNVTYPPKMKGGTRLNGLVSFLRKGSVTSLTALLKLNVYSKPVSVTAKTEYFQQRRNFDTLVFVQIDKKTAVNTQHPLFNFWILWSSFSSLKNAL